MPDWMRWLPSGVLALGCVFTLAVDRQHPMPPARPLDQIPDTIAGRPGVRGTAPADQLAAAGVSTYLMRHFDGSVAPFEIYVGYYEEQTQGRTIHSPKNCLPGSGWEALQQTTARIPTPSGTWTVNRYLLQNKDQRVLVFYWYQGRGRVAANEYRVKWELLRDAALLGRSEEALVRIVVRLNADTPEDVAADWAARAAADLDPGVFSVLPPR